MNAKLLNQAMNLFDTYEKYSAFIELSNARLEIRNRYFACLKAKILGYSINSPWSVKAENVDQYFWFLNEFKRGSIGLVWDTSKFYLWCEPSLFDAVKAKELLTMPRFEPIKGCFEYIDSISHPNIHVFFEERHRFEFSEDVYYSSLNSENPEKLSWFAGNKTGEMLDLIMKKVDKFRNEGITDLLIELNKECKITK